MKRNVRIGSSMLGLAAGAALLFTVGCDQQKKPTAETEKTASPAATDTALSKPVEEATKAAAAVAQSAATEAQHAAAAAKTNAAQAQAAATVAVQQAVETAKLQASAAAATATNQVQVLIEKAKGLVTDEKYKDALTTLQQLSTMQLSPEQQKLVDSLKEQVQTALAKAGASDALNSILGGKK